MINVKTLDQGRLSIPAENWISTSDANGSFELYVDNCYIGRVEFYDDQVLVISTLHKVELRGDS